MSVFHFYLCSQSMDRLILCYFHTKLVIWLIQEAEEIPNLYQISTYFINSKNLTDLCALTNNYKLYENTMFCFIFITEATVPVRIFDMIIFNVIELINCKHLKSKVQ